MTAPAFCTRYRHLPSVDAVLHCDGAQEVIDSVGRDLLVYAVRQTINRLRRATGTGKPQQEKIPPETILDEARKLAVSVSTASLRPVINATGIILHTNLGRAPLGAAILEALIPIVQGYSNLEFDLGEGKRGHRSSHIIKLLTWLTGAEDALVVNNNAAGIILTLHTLARGREVIVSRGELIEIGGAFRIPDIMAASGAKMVEVGTTNRTRSSDYESAITPDTALLFKAHKSNYTIAGFTEEVSVAELARLAHAHNLPMVYDIGSGLLRKPKIPQFAHEPDVRSALTDGADLVCFSGDKLLGGPQAGVVAGTQRYTAPLSKAPLMRALRVGKLTMAALSAACRNYLKDSDLVANNPLFSLLERSPDERRQIAERLAGTLGRHAIDTEIVESTVQCGGGTLPDLKLPGYAVALSAPNDTVKDRVAFAETTFNRLLQHNPPVLGILREGKLLFDTGALFAEQVEPAAEAIRSCVQPHTVS